MNVNGLGEQVVKGSSGQASNVLSAVYAQGNVTPGAGSNQQIFMFVGGHLANSDPAASIARFEQTYPSAQAVSAGSLGGEAECVTTTANNASTAMCVWFDNDSFGTLVSPTMSTAKLANTLDTVRPGIEQVGQ
jgi:phage baseplate assembly protein gpV